MSILNCNNPYNPLKTMYNSITRYMDNRIMKTGRNKALGSPGYYDKQAQDDLVRVKDWIANQYSKDPAKFNAAGITDELVQNTLAEAIEKSNKVHGLGVTDHAKGLFMTDQGVYSPFSLGGFALGGIYMGGAVANRM